MRHRVAGRRLGRTSEHRLAMRRNMVSSLFEHETISTTIEKAKEVKPFAEKLITLGKKGTLAARRRAISLLGNRDIFKEQDGKAVKSGTVIGKLFSELGPRYLDRQGGYSRIIRLSMRRLGDNGQLVLLQLVGKDEEKRKVSKSKTEKKGRGKVVDEAVEAEESVVAEETLEETVAEPAAEAADAEQAGTDEVQGDEKSETEKGVE
ncbi:MAG: 50S ribosomal protein L17 [Planctomycetota bacterium]